MVRDTNEGRKDRDSRGNSEGMEGGGGELTSEGPLLRAEQTKTLNGPPLSFPNATLLPFPLPPVQLPHSLPVPGGRTLCSSVHSTFIPALQSSSHITAFHCRSNASSTADDGQRIAEAVVNTVFTRSPLVRGISLPSCQPLHHLKLPLFRYHPLRSRRRQRARCLRLPLHFHPPPPLPSLPRPLRRRRRSVSLAVQGRKRRLRFPLLRASSFTVSTECPHRSLQVEGSPPFFFPNLLISSSSVCSSALLCRPFLVSYPRRVHVSLHSLYTLSTSIPRGHLPLPLFLFCFSLTSSSPSPVSDPLQSPSGVVGQRSVAFQL